MKRFTGSMNKCGKVLASIAGAIVMLFAAVSANSAVLINITELGGNVNISVSGSLNLLNATFDHFQIYTTGIIPGGENWYIASGTTPGLNWYQLTSVTLPLGTDTNYFSPPSSTSGDGFGIWGFAGNTPLVGVPTGYITGNPITSQMQFLNQSIGGLTLIPGTYTFNIPSDTITLNIDNIAPIPEPSTLLLLGSGFVGLIAYGRRRIKK